MRLRDPRAIDAFVRLVKTSPDPALRFQAIHGLGALKNREAIAVLVDLLDADYSTLDPHLWRTWDPKNTAKNPSAFYRARIAEQLAYITGHDLGENAEAWRSWLKANPTSSAAAP